MGFLGRKQRAPGCAHFVAIEPEREAQSTSRASTDEVPGHSASCSSAASATPASSSPTPRCSSSKRPGQRTAAGS